MTHLSVNISASGDTAIVSNAIASLRVNVFEAFLVGDTDVRLTVKDSAGSAISGPIPIKSGASLLLDLRRDPVSNKFIPWWQTALGTGLTFNLNVAVQLSGWIKYETSGLGVL